MTNDELKHKESLWLIAKDQDWSYLADDLFAHSYKRGDIIYRQSDRPKCVFFIKTGRVQLDILSFEGGKRTLFICDENAIFGELSLLNGEDEGNLCTATAITSCEILSLSEEKFKRRMESDIRFSRDLLKASATKTSLLSEIIKQQSFGTALYKVAYVLRNMAEQYSQPTDEGYIKLTITFSHQDIAYLTGLSRVSVSNILLKLMRDGLIGKEQDKYLVIYDRQALDDLVFNL